MHSNTQYKNELLPKRWFYILLLNKGIPVLPYGLEGCPLKKDNLNSLNFDVNIFFMRLFQPC